MFFYSNFQVKWRSFRIMAISVVLHFFGILIAIFGAIFFSIIGIYNSDSKQSNVYLLNVFQIVLGSFCTIVSLIFLVYFRIKIMYVKKGMEPRTRNITNSTSQINPTIDIEPERGGQEDFISVNNNLDLQVEFNPDVYYTVMPIKVNSSTNNELPPSYNSLNELNQIQKGLDYEA
jgi:hypothetical protein